MKKTCIVLLLFVCPALSAQNLTVTRLAGHDGGAGYIDGLGSAARFSQPNGVAVDISGNVYVSDSGRNAIRRISPPGVVSTLAFVTTPYGVAADREGNIYVTSTLNYRQGQTRANNAIVPLSVSGAIDVYTINHTASATLFIIDVVGWFE